MKKIEIWEILFKVNFYIFWRNLTFFGKNVKSYFGNGMPVCNKQRKFEKLWIGTVNFMLIFGLHFTAHSYKYSNVWNRADEMPVKEKKMCKITENKIIVIRKKILSLKRNIWTIWISAGNVKEL